MTTFTERARQKLFRHTKNAGVSVEPSPQISDALDSDDVNENQDCIETKPKQSESGKTSSFKAMLKNRFGNFSSSGAPPDSKISAISKAETLESSTASAGPSMASMPHGDSVLVATDWEEEDKSRKKKNPPPPGTYEYTVKDGDKLRSLAARFDTTPSVLKRLNRLTMDFLYPGQVLRIPDVDYVALNTKPNIDSPGSEVQTKDSADASLKSTKAFPGRIIRTEGSCHSIVDESELAPKPLSMDEAEYLDQECFERFIKLNSFYMTEHNGPIDGVLLVTPNAVMFDPNVSNSLVIEKGAEEFGMIAKMDSIMSAAIYHDIEAMECLQKRKVDDLALLKEHKESHEDDKTDPTLSKPLVYHAKKSEDPMAQEQQEDINVAALKPDQEAESHSTCSEDPQPKAVKPKTGADPGGLSMLPGGDSDVGTLPDAQSALADQSSQTSKTLTESPKSKVSFTVGDSVILNAADLLSRSMQDFSISSRSEQRHFTDSKTNNQSSDQPSPPASSESMCEDGGLKADESSIDDVTPAVDETPAVDVTRAVDITPAVDKTPAVDGTQAVDVIPAVNAQSETDVAAAAGETAVLEMVPNGLVTDNPTQLAQEPALYLCLKVGQPISNPSSSACPVESYSKKKRPEYWFSIPREKVDQLYAFFIQWKSEVYDNDDATAHERRFIAVKDEQQPSEDAAAPPPSPQELVYVKHHFGRHISLDWEIVSMDEVRRRRTIEDIEKYVPLPELMSESLILNESHIKQLVKCLPARVEGYPWYLAFGSEQHGFSLNQLYRNMQGLDSPVLLVILTTNDQIFGAASSCPFHMSDLFYGTGESFLYTFVDGFKTYPWSGSNNFFNKGDHSCLSIGAGEGSYGLWLDGDIYLGRTQNCLTYANDPLTGGEEDFHIKQVEVWCFHDE